MFKTNLRPRSVEFFRSPKLWVSYSVELHVGPRNVHWAGEPHAHSATETFGGAPSGATTRCTHVSSLLRPSIELPIGPRHA
eukprot:1684200-Pyramimonas_sp.AAC.1